MTEVVACLATIPPRHKELKLVCESLLPQVDRLFIYFNGYSEDSIPTWAKLMSKVVWECSETSGYGDLGDVGKFFFASEDMREKYKIHGDVFTCDDDIVYPEWYVDSTRKHLGSERFQNSILTYHGSVLPRKCRNYHKQKRCYAVRATVSKLTRVHVGGTGCMSFRVQRFRYHLSMFAEPNMADIFVAEWAKRSKVSLFVLPHLKGDFKILPLDDTIWHSTHSRDGTEKDKSFHTNRIVSSWRWEIF